MATVKANVMAATSDANAVEGDVLTPKIVYVKGKRIIGTYNPVARNVANLKTDGDFTEAWDAYWSANIASVSVSANTCDIVASSQTGGLTNDDTLAQVSGRVYYCGGWLKASGNGYALLWVGKNGPPFTTQGSAANTLTNTWEYVYFSWTASESFNLLIQVQDTRTSGWNNIYTKYITWIDLTAAFGAGNEPTAAQFYAFITNQGWANNFVGTNDKALLTW